MVLKSLFKSKEEKEKDKQKKSLKKQLDAVPSGGRGNNAKKLKLKRKLKELDKPKVEKPSNNGLTGRARTAYGTNPPGNKSDKSKKVKKKNNIKKTTGSSNFVTKNGKRYLKTSTMGKRIVADQKRKSLGSKNYMTKEMIEKRKKRLKIKK